MLLFPQVLWPAYPFVFADNVAEVAEFVAQKQMFITDLFGFVPGSGPGPEMWQQFTPPAAQLAALSQALGPAWLGMDVGEQDGRCVASPTPSSHPLLSSRHARGVVASADTSAGMRTRWCRRRLRAVSSSSTSERTSERWSACSATASPGSSPSATHTTCCCPARTHVRRRRRRRALSCRRRRGGRPASGCCLHCACSHGLRDGTGPHQRPAVLQHCSWREQAKRRAVVRVCHLLQYQSTRSRLSRLCCVACLWWR